MRTLSLLRPWELLQALYLFIIKLSNNVLIIRRYCILIIAQYDMNRIIIDRVAYSSQDFKEGESGTNTTIYIIF